MLAYPKVVDLSSSWWCCRSGVSSNHWPEKAVLVSSSDEDDGNDVLPIDMSAIPKDHFCWVPAEFNKVALSKHFGQARDSPSFLLHDYEVSHQVYWPFIDDESYLAREPSSMACRILGPNSPSKFQQFIFPMYILSNSVSY